MHTNDANVIAALGIASAALASMVAVFGFELGAGNFNDAARLPASAALSLDSNLQAELATLPAVANTLGETDPIAQLWKVGSTTPKNAIFKSYFTDADAEALLLAYSTALIGSGWKVEEARPELEGRYSSSYTKSGLRLWIYAQPNRSDYQGQVQFNVVLGAR